MLLSWAALVVAAALGLTGCGSEATTADGGLAVSATSAAAKPAAPVESKKPGALTKALSAAGDRSYDKTFDDIRFDMDPADDFVR
jgi:hypothetical protein